MPRCLHTGAEKSLLLMWGWGRWQREIEGPAQMPRATWADGRGDPESQPILCSAPCESSHRPDCAVGKRPFHGTSLSECEPTPGPQR